MTSNRIIQGDCIEMAEDIPFDSISLLLTSPPYNVNLGNNKYNKNHYDTYDDNMPYHEYLCWLREVFEAYYLRVRNGGRVVINIGDGANGRIPTHSDIIQFMIDDLGYEYNTTIIWNKSQVGNRCSWGSWCSPSCPSFPTPFEFLLVFQRPSPNKSKSGASRLVSDDRVPHNDSDLSAEEHKEWSLALWDIRPETRMNTIFNHPAAFPEELAKRCIKLFTRRGDLVVDPFNGSGTSTLVAHCLDRKYLGFDISEKYCETARNRIQWAKEDEVAKFLSESNHRTAEPAIGG